MARDYCIGLHRSRLENKRPSHLTPLSTVTNLEVCREDPYLAAPKQEGPPLLTTFEPKKKKKKKNPCNHFIFLQQMFTNVEG